MSLNHILILTILSVVLLGLLPLIAGMGLPRDHRAEATVFVPVNADELFQFAVNIDGWPDWRTGITHVEHVDPELHTALITADGDTIEYRFQGDFDDRRMIASIMTEGLPFGGRWIISVEALGISTSRILVVEEGFVDPPLWRFLSRFVFGHDTNIQQYVDDILFHCEDGSCGN